MSNIVTLTLYLNGRKWKKKKENDWNDGDFLICIVKNKRKDLKGMNLKALSTFIKSLHKRKNLDEKEIFFLFSLLFSFTNNAGFFISSLPFHFPFFSLSIPFLFFPPKLLFKHSVIVNLTFCLIQFLNLYVLKSWYNDCTTFINQRAIM